MPRSSKDLFDDSTMSFGEHLEVLRTHLFKALIGVAIGVVVALFYGSTIIAIVRQPIDRALKEYGQEFEVTDDAAALEQLDVWEKIKAYVSDQFSLDVITGGDEPEPVEEPVDETLETLEPKSATIRVHVNAGQLGEALHEAAPEAYPAPPEEAKSKSLALDLSAPEFSQFRSVVERSQQVVALNVQEPFLIYIKVSMIAGLVIASPWVFYQLWQFVAAGLFPHERKFVYLYGTLSGVLFFVGVVFCFYLVFPFVLKFLLGFNEMLGIQPQTSPVGVDQLRRHAAAAVRDQLSVAAGDGVSGTAEHLRGDRLPREAPHGHSGDRHSVDVFDPGRPDQHVDDDDPSLCAVRTGHRVVSVLAGQESVRRRTGRPLTQPVFPPLEVVRTLE